MIKVYTDGSYKPLLNSGGAGVYIEYQDGTKETIQYSERNSSSAKMEVKALELALTHLSKKHYTSKIKLFTDYQSNIDYVNKPVKEKTQLEIKTVKTLADKFKDLTVTWIKGHSGIDGNEKADKLAHNAALLAANNEQLSLVVVNSKLTATKSKAQLLIEAKQAKEALVKKEIKSTVESLTKAQQLIAARQSSIEAERKANQAKTQLLIEAKSDKILAEYKAAQVVFRKTGSLC